VREEKNGNSRESRLLNGCPWAELIGFRPGQFFIGDVRGQSLPAPHVFDLHTYIFIMPSLSLQTLLEAKATPPLSVERYGRLLMLVP